MVASVRVRAEVKQFRASRLARTCLDAAHSSLAEKLVWAVQTTKSRLLWQPRSNPQSRRAPPCALVHLPLAASLLRPPGWLGISLLAPLSLDRPQLIPSLGPFLFSSLADPASLLPALESTTLPTDGTRKWTSLPSLSQNVGDAICMVGSFSFQARKEFHHLDQNAARPWCARIFIQLLPMERPPPNNQQPQLNSSRSCPSSSTTGRETSPRTNGKNVKGSAASMSGLVGLHRLEGRSDNIELHATGTRSGPERAERIRSQGSSETKICFQAKGSASSPCERQRLTAAAASSQLHSTCSCRRQRRRRRSARRCSHAREPESSAPLSSGLAQPADIINRFENAEGQLR